MKPKSIQHAGEDGAEVRHSRSPRQTRGLAAALLGELPPGAVLALHGDLGAGKTCFVQGLAAALRAREPASSPTFTLINEYHGDRRLFHIDLYRINSEDEAQDLGVTDCCESDGLTVIEWAERAPSLLPPRTIHIDIAAGATSRERIIRIRRPPT